VGELRRQDFQGNVALEVLIYGKTLAHYHIVEQIDAGGMGVVFRAHDLQLDRDVDLDAIADPCLCICSRTRKFWNSRRN
jgi:hypothetical protein